MHSANLNARRHLRFDEGWRPEVPRTLVWRDVHGIADNLQTAATPDISNTAMVSGWFSSSFLEDWTEYGIIGPALQSFVERGLLFIVCSWQGTLDQQHPVIFSSHWPNTSRHLQTCQRHKPQCFKGTQASTPFFRRLALFYNYSHVSSQCRLPLKHEGWEGLANLKIPGDHDIDWDE